MTPLGPGPLIYAHRGDRIHAADNTLEAFELAIEHGADGIELDVRQTRDWQLVVRHDAFHPDAGLVADRTCAELRAADKSIPTLAEALETIGDRCYVNVEIKNNRPSFDRLRTLGRMVPAAIERNGVPDRVVVSSFDPLMVTAVRREAPGLLTAQLLDAGDPRTTVSWAAAAGRDAVNVPRAWVVDDAATTVNAAHDLAMALGVWTVNDPAEIEALAHAGVDVLFTDDPKAAREVLSD